jgi:hypothetical protein
VEHKRRPEQKHTSYDVMTVILSLKFAPKFTKTQDNNIAARMTTSA